ncbi:MAG: endonuclease/exonuclease/phosphatase family protein [Crocinitomicaceae bacterium]
MTSVYKYCLTIYLCQAFFVLSQNPQIDTSGIRIMFYNVENLFHPSNDSLKNDDEFAEGGIRYWNWSKYERKLIHIAQNIIAIGEWEPPAIVGLCEVENLQCLIDLLRDTPLREFGYEILHQESGDRRGIDVAYIYRPNFFNLVDYKSFVLNFPGSTRPSRDILYMKGLSGNDTLHCFVNHWPSRYGGELATKSKRNFAASVLKAKFDSIQKVNPKAKILAMGDFNDYPQDESMNSILSAKKDSIDIGASDLINLIWQYEKQIGTNKYQGEWHILDQFIINQNLLTDTKGLRTKFSLAQIFVRPWLMTKETSGFGEKPFRTYNGFKYIGGYSDHLPIYVDILFNK